MSSSSQKSNTASFLTVISILAIAALLVLAFYDVFSGEMRAGKYMDPQVATTVVEGTVYDRNGRILAMEVPVYELYINLDGIDNTKLDMLAQTLSFYCSYNQKQILNLCNQSESLKVFITSYEDEAYYQKMLAEVTSYGLNSFIYTVKASKRIYPAQFHMAQLILEVENLYSDTLNPRPFYGDQITYGSDIKLTTDLDIQYFSDLAVQKVYSLQNPQLVVCFIMDTENSELLALSTYPFYDLNSQAIVDMNNYAYLKSFSFDGTEYSPVLIINAGDTGNTEELRNKHEDSNLIRELFDSHDEEDTSSLVLNLSGPNNSYLVFIGSIDPGQNTGKEPLREAFSIIEGGLVSQSKL